MYKPELLDQIVEKAFPPGSQVVGNLKDVPPSARFWILPGKQGYPRWIIPQNPVEGLAVLREWRPFTGKTALTWLVLKQAYCMGVLGNIPGVHPLGVAIPKNTWGHLGWHEEIPPTPVVYVGTPSKITRLVVSLVHPRRRELSCVAKIPLGPLSGHGILREADILTQLAQEKPGLAPHVLYVNPHKAIAVQSPMLGTPAKPALTRTHIEWLLDLRLANQTTSLTEQARKLSDWIDRQGSMTGDTHAKLDAVLRTLQDDTPLPAVYRHGDFAPWNLKFALSGRLAVVDWEHATLLDLPFYDLMHFYYIQAHVARRQPNLLPKLLENPLVKTYLSTMNIDKALLPKLFLYYLLDYWTQRVADENQAAAQLYFEALMHQLEQINR